MRINIIASAEDEECGINHYTSDVESSLPIEYDRTGVKSYSLDIFHYISKTWSAINGNSQVIHLQHEYNIFGPGSICSWPVIILLLIARFFTEKRIVITFHNAWHKDTFGPPLRYLKIFYIWLNNHLLLLAADHVFYLSDNVEEKLVKPYEVENYTRIPHGVQIDTQNMTRKEARELLNWNMQADIIVMPGYIRPHKGYESFMEIAGQDSDRTYVVAGGVRNDIFEDYAENTFVDTPDNFERTGILNDEEFQSVFAAADLCYLPYQSASQSGIVNWAFAHGLPVFGSDIEYFRDLVGRTDAVKVVGSDPENVIPEIAAFFNNEECQTGMKEAASTFAEENSMEKVAESHVRIYESLQ